MAKDIKKLTEYGEAVRRYRAEARVKLRDHSLYVRKSISLLSAIEFGGKNLTDEILDKTIEFFDSFGINANDLREKAKYSSQKYEYDWHDLPQNDKRLFDCFATNLPTMTDEEKNKLLKMCKHK